jgi:hypothetical protein
MVHFAGYRDAECSISRVNPQVLVRVPYHPKYIRKHSNLYN